MYPDGVCRVTDNYYTKTVQFQDINYQLNQNEDKTAIFDGWCDFLNYFDSSIRFQLSFINLSATRDTYARRIAIPLQGDCFDKLRTEYTGMLQSQLARGNNGLIKTKYLTFGVEADSLKAAKPRLERVETDILNNFRRLGVTAESLNGMERLRLLHGMLHMDEPQPFRFSWDWLAPSGLSVIRLRASSLGLSPSNLASRSRTQASSPVPAMPSLTIRTQSPASSRSRVWSGTACSEGASPAGRELPAIRRTELPLRT